MMEIEILGKTVVGPVRAPKGVKESYFAQNQGLFMLCKAAWLSTGLQWDP